MEIDAENQRRLDFILSGQEALIGVVTPNLRVVQMTWDEKNITLYFVYDGAFTKEDEEESKRVAEKMAQDFPEYRVSATCQRVDFPQEFPVLTEKNRTWLYARRERPSW